jgi:hypothetical protein
LLAATSRHRASLIPLRHRASLIRLSNPPRHAPQLKLASAGTIPPLRPASLLLAVWVILFSAMVMCLGTVTAVRNIFDKLSS